MSAASQNAFLDSLGFPPLRGLGPTVELLEARAAQIKHSLGRSFWAHLEGTACILRAWRQPEALCVAGLAHSAYATQAFPEALLSESDRSPLRAAIGEDAERLVFAFCRLDRRTLWWQRKAPAEALPPALDRTTGQPLDLRPGELAALGILELANQLEQAPLQQPTADPQLRFSVRLARELVTLLQVRTPSVEALAALDPAGEQPAREAYQRGVKAYDSDSAGAIEQLELAARLIPVAPEPKLLLASLYLEAGDSERGKAMAHAAYEAALLLGTSWDKAMPWEQCLASAEELRSNAG